LKPAWQRLVSLRESQALAEQEEWLSAIELARLVTRSTARDQYWAEANLVLAECETELGNSGQARQQLQTLLSAPEFARFGIDDAAWWYVGESYLRERRYADALEAYMQIRPSETSRWYTAGLLQAAECLENLQRSEDARRVYQKLRDLTREVPVSRPASSRVDAAVPPKGTP
jgi:TolA-binding protein